jgi:Kelch motif/Galactose oxidase, central domain
MRKESVAKIQKQEMNLWFRSLGVLPAHAWFGFVSLVRTVLMVCFLASATNVHAQSGWSATGSLATGRHFHTAVLLSNGKVLVVGGIGPNAYFATATAELYDPATGQWSATGNMSRPRESHVAVRLTNGKVLVAGGFSGAVYGDPQTSAEIYDPESGTWSAAGSLSVARGASHSATLLADGRVLVTGGFEAELYDPATDVWSPAGTMNSPRVLHTATLLPDGRVLVVGGTNLIPLRSAELYDPYTRSWTPTGDLSIPRVVHTANLLHNGKVLIAGGGRSDYPFDHGNGVDNAELYDPATGQWSATGSLTAPRVAHTTTLLPDGRVLAAGGFNDGRDNTSAEVYDPATGSWSVADSMISSRSFHTATLLTNGKVLVAGGSSPSGSLNNAESYDLGFEVPLLTLNSTSYCIGVPWTLLVIRSARETSVRLLGVSNGASWEIVRWGATNQEGSFTAGGSIADGSEGTHTLSVEINGIRSNAVSFAVSKCKP